MCSLCTGASGGEGARLPRQGSAETSFQHPFEHPESHQTGDLCSIPLPCKEGGLFGLFKITVFTGTDPRNAAQIGLNERIALATAETHIAVGHQTLTV